MMTQTVHDFPLFGSKPSDEVEILEGGVFHVDEVVGNAGYWEHEVAADEGEGVR
jgi:hypothetical protein